VRVLGIRRLGQNSEGLVRKDGQAIVSRDIKKGDWRQQEMLTGDRKGGRGGGGEFSGKPTNRSFFQSTAKSFPRGETVRRGADREDNVTRLRPGNHDYRDKSKGSFGGEINAGGTSKSCSRTRGEENEREALGGLEGFQKGAKLDPDPARSVRS